MFRHDTFIRELRQPWPDLQRANDQHALAVNETTRLRIAFVGS